MSNSLKEKAREVLGIIEAAGYRSLSGNWVDLSPYLESSVEGSRLYRPGFFSKELGKQAGSNPKCKANITLANETTQQAAGRMYAEGLRKIALLNFASARNPGGGFLSGAKAQEEDLTRCSTLYACLSRCMEYYDYNRARDTMLYSDMAIFSPEVPWFRTRSRDEPDELYVASVITAPAPNAGEALKRGMAQDVIESTMLHRCGLVLEIARQHNCRNLILGAWGCGVFRNDPRYVASAFQHWLNGLYAECFDSVHFAVYDRSKSKETYRAFEEQYRD